MKKTAIKLAIALLAVLAIMAPMAFATTGGNDLLGLKPDTSKAQGKTGVVNQVIGIIQFIGVAIALGMLIIIGIKYITASPEGKGDIKATAINYLFGAICIFAATAILGGIAGLTKSIQ